MFSSRITKAGGLVTGGGDVFRDEHSLSFGGDNDYLSCESNFESILFNAPFSMVFWLKADDGRPSAIEYLVGTKSGEDNIWARIETDGDIQFYYKEGSTESNVTASAYFADGPSGWVQLAFTLSDSAQVIYANGVAIASGATSISTSGFAQDTNRDCVIAARNNQGTIDGHFAGKYQILLFIILLYQLLKLQLYIMGENLIIIMKVVLQRVYWLGIEWEMVVKMEPIYHMYMICLLIVMTEYLKT